MGVVMMSNKTLNHRILYVIYILIVFISISHASEIEYYLVKVESLSPDSKSIITGDIKLMSPDIQVLYINNGILKKERIFHKTYFRYNPVITWHNNETVEAVIGTGSPGRYSIFYNLKSDTFSDKMWFVLAYDKNRQIALLGEEKLHLVKVFDNKEIMVIEIPDIMLTAINFLVVKSASFDSDGNLRIKYLDTNKKHKSTIINLENIKY